MNNKNKKQTLYIGLIISVLLANFFILPPNLSAEDDIEDLNIKISEKRKEVGTLQQEIDAYQEQIVATQKKAKTLKNQIAILDNQIAKVNLDIEATDSKIDQTKLEIQATNLQITLAEEKIEDQKNKVAQYLRLIHRTDQVNLLEVLLVNNSLAEFFDQVKQVQDIHNDLKENVNELKTQKQALDINKSNLESKILLEEELKGELKDQKTDVEEKNVAHSILLVQEKLTEKEYQQFSHQLKLEQQAANADISSLEKEVRTRLEERDAIEKFAGFGPARLAWPVPPLKITTDFHDPDYPFRYLFEHPGIDVRAAQGTPIKAPEAGYVGRVKFDGTTGYSYVVIIHNDGLSSVFGHISKPMVSENEFVTKGQVVALSGGAPKSIGAGNLTTAAHLHYEVRLNGIPVNPLEYLPAL